MKILLVEDENRMAQALCEILNFENYDVDHFDNGYDGLYGIENEIYGVAIIDIMLSGINVFEIVKKLEKKELKHRFFLTAKSDVEDKVNAKMRIVRQLENLGSYQTGGRSLLRLGGFKMKFSPFDFLKECLILGYARYI